MGQQQLLLIVLGIIITGFAIVVGLQAFALNQKQANIDAMLLTGLRIASEAQAWAQVPVTLGGGLPTTGGSTGDFTGISVELRDLGYTVDGADNYITLNGTFTLDNTGSSILIEAASATTSGGDDVNLICITVLGLKQEDIVTIINPDSGSCGAAPIAVS